MNPQEKRKKRFESTRDMICSNGNKGHDWMPVAWTIGPDSKHVSAIMCKRCFCSLSINDGYEFGAKPKEV